MLANHEARSSHRQRERSGRVMLMVLPLKLTVKLTCIH